MNLIVISGQILRIRTEINKKFIDLAFFFSFFFFFDFIWSYLLAAIQIYVSN